MILTEWEMAGVGGGGEETSPHLKSHFKVKVIGLGIGVCCFVLLIPTLGGYRVPRVSPGVNAPP
jgi:hypothetical protein